MFMCAALDKIINDNKKTTRIITVSYRFIFRFNWPYECCTRLTSSGTECMGGQVLALWHCSKHFSISFDLSNLITYLKDDFASDHYTYKLIYDHRRRHTHIVHSDTQSVTQISTSDGEGVDTGPL